MYTGRCLCGGIRFSIRGELQPIQICYCTQCQRAQGNPFASVIPIRTADFHLESGAELIQHFESSPGKERCFCGTCGCHLFSKAAHRPGMIFVRAGSLDDDPQIRPQHHFWVSAKAPWYEICDAVPQHLEGLPK